MILRTRHGNVELRSEFGNSSDLRPPWSAWLSASGLPVTPEQAFGLPAVSNVVRSAADVIASLPFMVYRDGDVRARAPESWQYELLHDRPSDLCDSFEFFYDLALSLEATQNAFIQKGKFNGRVYVLYVLDPQRVAVRQDRETGQKLFDIYLSDGVRRDVTTDEILHIRGFATQPGALAGVSLMQLHRDPLGAAIAMQRFEGDYFRNSAVTPLVFELGPSGNEKQASALLDAWDGQHAGTGMQFKTGAIWGETKLTPIPLSLKDALFADAKRLSVEDVCRIWRWPREWVGLTEDQPPGDPNATLAQNMKLYLLPRLRRIERAFAADQDIFWESGLFGEFLTEGLERADVKTRYEAYRLGRQGGWLAPNEARAFENLPPKEGGDDIQLTPVGGTENPGQSQEPSEQEDEP